MNFQMMTQKTVLPACIPYPKFLNRFDLSDGSKLLYCYYLNQTMERSHVDDSGRVYVVVNVAEAAELMGKSVSTIKRLTKELEAHGLLRRSRQRIGKPACVYLCFPSDSEA